MHHAERPRGLTVDVLGHHQRRTAGGRDGVHHLPDVAGGVAAVVAHPLHHGRGGALADPPGAVAAQVEVDTGHAGLRREGHEVGVGNEPLVPGAQSVLFLGQHDDGAALRGLVGQAGQLGRIGDAPRVDSGDRQELGGLPVAEGDGAGLVQQQGVDVAGRLDGTAGHGEDVALHEPVHPGDADRGQQRPDRGGDQADQQRHQHDAGDPVGVEGGAVRRSRVVALGVDRDRLERDHRQQEDDGQRGEQDVQRDLVGRLLPVRALDQGDHPVDEALPGLLRDRDDDPVGEHLGAAGDGAAIAAGLPDHRGRLAGDGGLVHAGDALHHVAVAGDDVAGLADDHVALAQLRRRHPLLAVGADGGAR